MSRKGLEPAPHEAALYEQIETWLTLCNDVEAREKAFKAEIAGDKKLISQLEANILATMRKNKTGNVKLTAEFGAEHPGTAYVIRKHQVKVADAEEFFAHILETGNTDLLHKRASAEAVAIYAEEHEGKLPPGVLASVRLTLGFRADNGAA